MHRAFLRVPDPLQSDYYESDGGLSSNTSSPYPPNTPASMTFTPPVAPSHRVPRARTLKKSRSLKSMKSVEQNLRAVFVDLVQNSMSLHDAGISTPGISLSSIGAPQDFRVLERQASAMDVSVPRSRTPSISRALSPFRKLFRPPSALDRPSKLPAVQSKTKYATCTRCGTGFKKYVYNADGDIILYNEEECHFHPGRIEEWLFDQRCFVGNVSAANRTAYFWSCCTEDPQAPGCCRKSRHRGEDDPTDVLPPI
ncbi:hypothetical protein PLEOSDRAFT_161041 [Pleurotus ostreatus PC15]|uniref:Uncharacterized protein n=1 Tax=Pleurotus ostreatus (strain PC15) TaxID=1137138 RepID=A0A067NMT5_PLEO1|nr:hypothetical protein PLEOSDRAFT_161041 [Pleurotus ostreatus PC15]